MPQQNLEIMRRLFDAWNRRDWQAFESVHRRDVVTVPPDGWPEAEVLEDYDAWFRQAMRLIDSWEEQRVEVEELRETGDRVVARFRWITKGKDSRIELETHMAAIYTLEEGKVARIEFFVDPSKALDASAE